MARISDARKAERLNHAWRLLQRGDDLSDLVERMARDCAISERQAYRYLAQARSLKAPVAITDEKTAFTVKLPRGLVQQVREYARARRLSLSELVARALRRLLARR
jgi:predicted DNA-binding transcriptional regulator YafY